MLTKKTVLIDNKKWTKLVIPKFCSECGKELLQADFTPSLEKMPWPFKLMWLPEFDSSTGMPLQVTITACQELTKNTPWWKGCWKGTGYHTWKWKIL